MQYNGMICGIMEHMTPMGSLLILTTTYKAITYGWFFIFTFKKTISF